MKQSEKEKKKLNRKEIKVGTSVEGSWAVEEKSEIKLYQPPNA